MGKKSLAITGPNVYKNIGMLNRAYAFEMQTSQYFQYITQNIEGLGILFQDFFGEPTKEEQGHSAKINDRLLEQGTNPTDDSAMWATESGIGKIKSKKYL